MRDDKGQSPLDIALEDLYDEYSIDIALYLMSRGCACGDEDKAKLLCGVCWSGRLDMVKELVEHHKVDPKSECDDLHDCCVLEYFAVKNLRMSYYHQKNTFCDLTITFWNACSLRFCYFIVAN